MNSLDQADRLSIIALDVVRELRDELQDGELDAAIAAMDEPEGKRRKVVSPEEFYSTEFPNVVPPYEKPEEYQR